SVRVDNLKSLLFEYKKTIAEQKLIEIKKLKIKRKIENATDDLDKLEAEVELEMVEIEKRQKEIALENIMSRSNHTLRSIFDFHGEFVENEKLCEKRGFTYKDWNNQIYPITERIHKEVLSIPMSQILMKEKVSTIVNAINQFK
ncbi:MAG: hypothetical protein WCI71_15735, partial [Bacteroidota bacterium]